MNDLGRSDTNRPQFLDGMIDGYNFLHVVCSLLICYNRWVDGCVHVRISCFSTTGWTVDRRKVATFITNTIAAQT
ncbi:hypothetical protein T07_11370 [Trichinella nelsoni]|uniref:Uncharacterized protein n=1 Tax=Trichinella nelsoni TaxID=6336 RepID=A0A0V0RWZ3_9BILA|nr:hypothetical protein T07_11370 [Trichinella nelsoni]